jgi:thioredoxin 1
MIKVTPIIRNQLKLNSLRRTFGSNYSVVCDENDFQKKQTEPGRKVLYFTASWCPPCKAIAPVFETLSKQSPNISFLKIDVDNLSETAQKYNIRSVPTFVFEYDNKVISKVNKSLFSRNFFKSSLNYSINSFREQLRHF